MLADCIACPGRRHRWPTPTLAGPLGPYVVAATGRGIVAAGWGSVADLATDLERRPRPARRRDTRGSPRCPAIGPCRSSRRWLPASRPTPSRCRSTSGSPGLGPRVLAAVREVRAGSARRATARSPGASGAPRAARAVGGALGRNPDLAGDPVPPDHRRRRDARRLRRRRAGSTGTARSRARRHCSCAKGSRSVGAAARLGRRTRDVEPTMAPAGGWMSAAGTRRLRRCSPSSAGATSPCCGSPS